MNLKQFFLGAALALAFSTTAWAQPAKAGAYANKSPEERAKMATHRMSQGLDLSPEQHQKLYEVNLEAEQKLDPILKSSAESGNRKEEGKAVQIERDQKIKEVLTAEQYQQYKNRREEKMEQYKERKEKTRATDAAPQKAE